MVKKNILSGLNIKLGWLKLTETLKANSSIFQTCNLAV